MRIFKSVINNWLLAVILLAAAPCASLIAAQSAATTESIRLASSFAAFEYGRFGVNNRLGGAQQLDMARLEELLTGSGSQWQTLHAYYQASVPILRTVINPGPGQTYNWAHLDQSVTGRAERNIRTLLILAPYNSRGTMPSDLESWKEFVKEVVNRYGGQSGGEVRYFALNNEPSVPGYWNDTAENYALLLRATAEAVKAADSAAMVVLGSMPADVVVNQPSQQDFFPTVLKYTYGDSTVAEDYFDIFDIHIYDKYSTFQSYVEFARSLMTRYKPMIMTETATGSDTTYGGGLDGQARDVVKRWVTAFSLGIEAATWQPFADHEPLGVPNPERFSKSGFLDVNLNPKPSYYTFGLMIRKLTRFSSLEKQDEGIFKFAFQDKEPVFVLWDDSGSGELDLSGQFGGGNVLITHIVEESGDSLAKTEIAPSGNIPVGRSPVFVESSRTGDPGDLDANGRVDIFDLLALLKVLGGTSDTGSADVNGDGTTDIFDLLALLKALRGGSG